MDPGGGQVSNWYDHPGGSVIFTHAGDDFTDIFAAFHPPSASDALEAFYIGELHCRPRGFRLWQQLGVDVLGCAVASAGDVDEKSVPKTQQQLDFEKAYRDLRAKLVAMGMFNARCVPGCAVDALVSEERKQA